MRSFFTALFLTISLGSNAQTKLTKATIERLGKVLIKQVDTTFIFVPNASCDTITFYVDNKKYIQKLGSNNDSMRRATSVRCKLKPYSKLEIVCGKTRTRPVKIKHGYKYIYVSMGENFCDLYFSDTPIGWDNEEK